MRRSSQKSKPRQHFEIEGEAFMVAPHDEAKPKTISEALSSSAKEQSKRATEEEMESINTNQIWKLVDLPLGPKAIGNK